MKYIDHNWHETFMTYCVDGQPVTDQIGGCLVRFSLTADHAATVTEITSALRQGYAFSTTAGWLTLKKK